MRALYEQGAVLRVKALILALSAVVLALPFFSHAAFAEDTPSSVSDPANQTDSHTVPSPGIPSATSSAADHTIVWAWAAPAGGLTPDAAKAQDPAQPDPSNDQTLQTQTATEQPTDIIQYGYELSKQGIVVTTGVVSADTPTVTTTVTEDGDYVFKVWSVNRIAAVSAPAFGSITITTPQTDPGTLPPIGDDIIPAPINTTLLEKASAAAVSNAAHPLLKQPTKSSKTSSQPAPSDVLGASNVSAASGPMEKVAAAVKPSSQGWVIFGLPWYLWMLSLGALFIAGRWALSFIRH